MCLCPFLGCRQELVAVCLKVLSKKGECTHSVLMYAHEYTTVLEDVRNLLPCFTLAYNMCKVSH